MLSYGARKSSNLLMGRNPLLGRLHHYNEIPLTFMTSNIFFLVWSKILALLLVQCPLFSHYSSNGSVPDRPMGLPRRELEITQCFPPGMTRPVSHLSRAPDLPTVRSTMGLGKVKSPYSRLRSVQSRICGK